MTRPFQDKLLILFLGAFPAFIFIFGITLFSAGARPHSPEYFTSLGLTLCISSMGAFAYAASQRRDLSKLLNQQYNARFPVTLWGLVFLGVLVIYALSLYFASFINMSVALFFSIALVIAACLYLFKT
jgi:hypothetical protein